LWSSLPRPPHTLTWTAIVLLTPPT
jgi:hypothetical protein